jgi:hypothetical protein
MVRAAATGAFNFAGHDPLDHYWWRRLRWTLNELVRKSNLEYHSREFAFQTGLLSCQRIASSDWEANQTKCGDTLAAMHHDLFPWVAGASKPGTTGTEANQLERLWVEHFGDPNDPAVQAQLAQGIAAMQQLGEEE